MELPLEFHQADFRVLIGDSEYHYNFKYRAYRVSPPPPSVYKYSICACLRDVVHISEMLCMFPSSCVRFTEVVSVSQTRSPGNEI